MSYEELALGYNHSNVKAYFQKGRLPSTRGHMA